MKYNRIIFVCEDNTCRSPMAEAIMKQINRSEGLTVSSRGVLVLFPEPYNPKAASVLRSNGIIMENGESAQLEASDLGRNVLVLTMNAEEKNKLLNNYRDAENIYTITEFAGGTGDIPDPYGADMEAYAHFYEVLKQWIERVEDRIYNTDI